MSHELILKPREHKSPHQTYPTTATLKESHTTLALEQFLNFGIIDIFDQKIICCEELFCSF
jgi:hypothetical protein